MLSGLLDTIKSQFTSKSYWLGAMMPLLLFLFANGILVHRHAPRLMKWLTSVQGLEATAFVYSLLLAILLAVAYILSILSSPMLQVLEGQHLPVLSALLYRVQWGRIMRIDREYDRAVGEENLLEKRCPTWKNGLLAARKAGEGKAAPGWKKWLAELLSNDNGRWTLFHLASVRFRMRHGCRVKVELLEKTVTDLTHLLGRLDADRNVNRTLDAAHADLLNAMQYALDRAQFDRISLLNYRQFHFPGARPSAPEKKKGPSTSSLLAPTSMGNIGRTIRSYALTRYQLDLDILWTRLQSALQKDGAAYFSSLQDSKAQLDCTVTMVWLSAIFTLLWTVALLYFCADSTMMEFRVVGISGTVATIISYWLACSSYRTFADVVRSCVDLFRLKVIDGLSLPQPYGSEEERELWRRVGDAIGYGAREQFKYKTP